MKESATNEFVSENIRSLLPEELPDDPITRINLLEEKIEKLIACLEEKEKRIAYLERDFKESRSSLGRISRECFSTLTNSENGLIEIKKIKSEMENFESDIERKVKESSILQTKNADDEAFRSLKREVQKSQNEVERLTQYLLIKVEPIAETFDYETKKDATGAKVTNLFESRKKRLLDLLNRSEGSVFFRKARIDLGMSQDQFSHFTKKLSKNEFTIEYCKSRRLKKEKMISLRSPKRRI